MGTEYAFVRDDNRTMFNLGKGSFYNVIPAEGGGLPSDLAERYADMLRLWSSTPLPYAKDLARRILAWGEGHLVRAVNDFDGSVFTCEEEGYVYTGSRYVMEWTEDGYDLQPPQRRSGKRYGKCTKCDQWLEDSAWIVSGKNLCNGCYKRIDPVRETARRCCRLVCKGCREGWPIGPRGRWHTAPNDYPAQTMAQCRAEDILVEFGLGWADVREDVAS